MGFLDFVVGEFFRGKKFDFFHFDHACWYTIFPLADWTFKDQLICAAVSDDEGAFTADLVVKGFTVPFVDEGRVDLFEFGFGGEGFFGKHETKADEGSVGLALALGL